jgi:uracil-DNA glycosylase family 4
MQREGRTARRLALALRAERAFGVESVIAPHARDLAAARAEAGEQSVAQPGQIREPQPARPAVPPVRGRDTAPVAARVESSRRPAASMPATTPPADLYGRPLVSKIDISVPAGPGGPDFTSPVLPTDEKRRLLETLDATEVKGCTRCRLCQTRTHTVFGEGDVDAKIFFIGEGPGETEDQTGRPFVGKAGQLLDKMINAMGLRRDQVYIANIVKCRPPGNREPAPDEVATCTPYLLKQIETVRPEAIVTLGKPASQYMLQCNDAMGKMRGRWFTWRGIRLMPTYHPSYVLRTYTPEVRRTVWNDLKQVLEALGLPVPRRSEQG